MTRNLIALLIVVSALVILPGVVRKAHRASIERQAAAQMEKTNNMIDSILDAQAERQAGESALNKLGTFLLWLGSTIIVLILLNRTIKLLRR